jgi:hypothetical protein
MYRSQPVRSVEFLSLKRLHFFLLIKKQEWFSISFLENIGYTKESKRKEKEHKNLEKKKPT